MYFADTGLMIPSTSITWMRSPLLTVSSIAAETNPRDTSTSIVTIVNLNFIFIPFKLLYIQPFRTVNIEATRSFLRFLGPHVPESLTRKFKVVVKHQRVKTPCFENSKNSREIIVRPGSASDPEQFPRAPCRSKHTDF